MSNKSVSYKHTLTKIHLSLGLKLAITLMLMIPAICSAQVAMFVKITASNQGFIGGDASGIWAGIDVTDFIEVDHFSHQILAVRDTASGQPTGARTHKPLVISKPLDKSSAGLMQALVANEILNEVLIYVFDNSNTGETIIVQTITLSNAKIIARSNAVQTGAERGEYITLIYQNITWSSPGGQTQAMDSWQ